MITAIRVLQKASRLDLDYVIMRQRMHYYFRLARCGSKQATHMTDIFMHYKWQWTGHIRKDFSWLEKYKTPR